MYVPHTKKILNESLSISKEVRGQIAFRSQHLHIRRLQLNPMRLVFLNKAMSCRRWVNDKFSNNAAALTFFSSYIFFHLVLDNRHLPGDE